MESTPSPQPVPILRPNALHDGFSDHEIRRLRRNGTWISIRRGSYIPPDELTPLDEAQRHALLIRSTKPGLRIPGVVSHSSAAVLWGIPLWATPLDLVHITRSRPATGGRSGSLLCHSSALGADEVVSVDGLEVTSPARTVADLARTLPFEQAVVAADGALRLALLTARQLMDAVSAIAGAPGSRSALRVARFANGLSESVGESRSRVLMSRVGLLEPTLQFNVFDSHGRALGRSDFAWHSGRLLGEFDGKIKYGRLLKEGETAGDVIYREKLREDALRDNGARVVRWVWADIETPWRFAERIKRALDAVENA
jgi:hypothetical protein